MGWVVTKYNMSEEKTVPLSNKGKQKVNKTKEIPRKFFCIEQRLLFSADFNSSPSQILSIDLPLYFNRMDLQITRL